VLADPCTCDWLKAAIASLVDGDPVDALNDALVLACLFDERPRIAWRIDVEDREDARDREPTMPGKDE
jgi:hypothetical protein